MRVKLDTYALQGYRGEPCALIATSPAWYAFKLGQYLKASGRAEPSDVRMSRGSSIRCRDSVYRPADEGEVSTFERIQ